MYSSNINLENLILIAVPQVFYFNIFIIISKAEHIYSNDLGALGGSKVEDIEPTFFL